MKAVYDEDLDLSVKEIAKKAFVSAAVSMTVGGISDRNIIAQGVCNALWESEFRDFVSENA
jgi:hypothetical protein